MKRNTQRKPTRTKRKSKAAHSSAAQVAAARCACGCGQEVKPGSKFRQGHDARLRPNSAWRKSHPELFGNQ